MGNIFNKKNNDENCYITQMNNTDEDNLDLSNIDKLQIKVLKELIKGIERCQGEKK